MFKLFRKKRSPEYQEAMSLGLEWTNEFNDAIDEFFGRIEVFSLQQLEILSIQLEDLSDDTGRSPRTVSENLLIDSVEDWRDIASDLKDGGLQVLSGWFETANEIGVRWKADEVYEDRWKKADFDFAARAVIVAGEAADKAENSQ
ncbi:MAG: hypothetical protein ACK519_05610 [Sphingomonadaceae bacterium]